MAPPDDTILRTTAYYRKDVALAVMNLPDAKHDKVRSSITYAFDNNPAADLGNMGLLPLEIMAMIFKHCDILTLFRFRQVNRLARALVSSDAEYHIITENAMDCLSSVLRTGLGSHYSFGLLYDILCTQDCVICDRFGVFLFLPAGVRCCQQCTWITPVEGDGGVPWDEYFYGELGNKATAPAYMPRCPPPPPPPPPPRSYDWQVPPPSTWARQGPRECFPSFNIRKWAMSKFQLLDCSAYVALKTIEQVMFQNRRPVNITELCTTLPYIDRKTKVVDWGWACKGCRLRSVKAFAPWLKTYSRLARGESSAFPRWYAEAFRELRRSSGDLGL